MTTATQEESILHCRGAVGSIDDVRVQIREALTTKALNTIVYFAAKKMLGMTDRGLHPEVYASAVVAVLECVDRFEARDDCSFFSYAAATARGSILDSRKLYASMNTVRQKSYEDEFSEVVPFTEAEHGQAWCDITSQNRIVEDDWAHDVRERIYEVLDHLSDRQRAVLCMLYGLGGELEHTLEDIARKFNRTKSCIALIRDKAIRKLQHLRRCRRLIDSDPVEVLHYNHVVLKTQYEPLSNEKLIHQQFKANCIKVWSPAKPFAKKKLPPFVFTKPIYYERPYVHVQTAEEAEQARQLQEDKANWKSSDPNNPGYYTIVHSEAGDDVLWCTPEPGTDMWPYARLQSAVDEYIIRWAKFLREYVSLRQSTSATDLLMVLRKHRCTPFYQQIIIKVADLKPVDRSTTRNSESDRLPVIYHDRIY